MEELAFVTITEISVLKDELLIGLLEKIYSYSVLEWPFFKNHNTGIRKAVHFLYFLIPTECTVSEVQQITR